MGARSPRLQPLAVFPALLILPGVRAFQQWQQKSYGNAGLWGYRLAFSGLVLAAFRQIWDYVLFDPWVHPSTVPGS